MGNISVALPSDGETIDASDYNTPINTIVNEINGELDNSNIASGAAIAGSKLANGAITADKLALGGNVNSVATAESTTSTTYTDLATVGPAVTITVPSTGVVLVSMSAAMNIPSAEQAARAGVALTGANTVAVDDGLALDSQTIYSSASRTFLITGLTAGSTTFTMKYSTTSSGSAAGFRRRSLSVIPLG